MTNKRKPPQSLGEQEFEHMHVLGPILWAIVAYTGAVAAFLLHVPVLYVVLVGAGVTTLAPLVSVHRWFAFALMAATTGLLTWTTVTTPLQRDPLLAAAAGGLLFGLTYQVLRKREPAAVDEDAAAAKAASGGKYIDLLESVGAKGLKEARRLPFPAGKTIVLLLPVKGVTLTSLNNLTESLHIAAARAGLACTFEFEASPDSRAEVLLHVFDHDVLADTLPLEFERREKSIHDAMPLGRFPTGEECSIVFREKAEMLVGIKGKGKSNLINVQLAHLTGCPDAVVWFLDGKGTRTVGPWIEAYLAGECERPAIDWPAFTDDEFHNVLLATEAVIKYRARQFGGEKVHPTSSLPAVDVVVEEASVITSVARRGGHSNVQLAQGGVVQGRSEGVDWIFASQRATVTMLGNGDMKSNLDLRIGLGVTDEADARSIFPDGKLARVLAKLGTGQRYRGVFLMQDPESARVMPVKGYRIEPEALRGMAVTNSRWSGTLDRGTADFVHAELLRQGVAGGYHGRWDRIRAALGEAMQAPLEIPQRDVETPRDGTAVSRGAQAVQDAVSASRAKREAESLDKTFDELMAANFETVEVADETHLRDVSEVSASVPPVLRLMLAAFTGRSADELPSRVLCADLPGDLNPTGLGRLMAHCNVSPVENIVWDGKRARGYTRDGIETAIKRGSWSERAFDWQP